MDAETRMRRERACTSEMETREIERERNVGGTQAVAGSEYKGLLGVNRGIDEATKNEARRIGGFR